MISIVIFLHIFYCVCRGVKYEQHKFVHTDCLSSKLPTNFPTRSSTTGYVFPQIMHFSLFLNRLTMISLFVFTHYPFNHTELPFPTPIHHLPNNRQPIHSTPAHFHPTKSHHNLLTSILQASHPIHPVLSKLTTLSHSPQLLHSTPLLLPSQITCVTSCPGWPIYE